MSIQSVSFSTVFERVKLQFRYQHGKQPHLSINGACKHLYYFFKYLIAFSLAGFYHAQNFTVHQLSAFCPEPARHLLAVLTLP